MHQAVTTIRAQAAEWASGLVPTGQQKSRARQARSLIQRFDRDKSLRAGDAEAPFVFGFP